MPWRFRRSLKILPGVRMNLGKRGTSFSVGGRFGGMTFGPSGVRRRVSLPGTGLSFTQKAGDTAHRTASASGSKAGGCGCRTLGVGVVALLGIALLAGICGQLAPGKPVANQPTAAPTPAPARPQSTSKPDEASSLEPRDLTETAQPARLIRVPVTATVAEPSPTIATTALTLPTASLTDTPTPPPGPVAVQDANLRSGPGTEYPIIGYVKAGQALEIAACNAEGTWFELAGKPWIFAELVQNGRCPRVASNIAPPPPPPTFTALPPARLLPTNPPPVVQPPPPPPPARSCCRICTSGKACGDGCIAANRTCRQPPGCACNG